MGIFDTKFTKFHELQEQTRVSAADGSIELQVASGRWQVRMAIISIMGIFDTKFTKFHELQEQTRVSAADGLIPAGLYFLL